ncbi:MAG: hypothetical protein HY812_17445 [Planctomycetes bacterium]|nr:hypothetical protein [Planctomycetota bacterium]
MRSVVLACALLAVSGCGLGSAERAGEAPAVRLPAWGGGADAAVSEAARAWSRADLEARLGEADHAVWEEGEALNFACRAQARLEIPDDEEIIGQTFHFVVALDDDHDGAPDAYSEPVTVTSQEVTGGTTETLYFFTVTAGEKAISNIRILPPEGESTDAPPCGGHYTDVHPRGLRWDGGAQYQISIPLDRDLMGQTFYAVAAMDLDRDGACDMHAEPQEVRIRAP